MSSRSIHRWLVLAATLVLWVQAAHAGRKRVVILDFDGPKAEKFQKDVVKLVGKKHTVVSTEKWNAAAEQMDAGKVTEKNVKKLAKKLKVDGVITGKVNKRRDEYIIKLKLRSGTTGEILGSPMQTKAEGPRLDGQAQRDIKDELISQLDELESNRGGGGDDEGDEEKPKKKKKGDDEDEGDEGENGKKSGFSKKDDSENKKGKKGDDEDKPKKKKKGDDEEAAALAIKKDDDEEDRPKKKKRSDDDEEKPRKRKASRDDDEGEGEDGDSITEDGDDDEEVSGDVARNLSPAGRAVDAVVGLSFTRRNLAFTYASDLGKVPPGYRQAIPVAGAIVDLTVFPMAFGHTKKDITTGIGLNVLYDQVLVINSRKRFLDGMGTAQTADLTTKSNRWLVGGVFRYPLGSGAKAPVVGGSLSYGKQSFTIAQELPNMEPTDIPNVTYKMITPSAFVRFPVTEQININLDAGFHAVMDTGAIQTRTQYGAATVAGYDLELGGDYMVTKNIFARAAVRYQAISFEFKGDPMSQTHTRDTDAEQDVTGAKDVYFGGTVTAGYVF